MSSDIAVACLMGRHRRLGMHSQFRKIPNYVIRHILSILGSPFDLLNDHVNVVNRHVLNDHSVVNSDGSICRNQWEDPQHWIHYDSGDTEWLSLYSDFNKGVQWRYA